MHMLFLFTTIIQWFILHFYFEPSNLFTIDLIVPINISKSQLLGTRMYEGKLMPMNNDIP